jgi:hypothetical protein
MKITIQAAETAPNMKNPSQMRYSALDVFGGCKGLGKKEVLFCSEEPVVLVAVTVSLLVLGRVYEDAILRL